MKRALLILILIPVLLIALCSCRKYTENVYEFAMICEDGDLSKLDAYPNLQYLDLRGSTCYDEILKYAADHPDITVRYSVDLGKQRISQDVTDISLLSSEFQYDTLLKNLKYLPAVKTLNLIHTELSADQLLELTAAYPGIKISYDVKHADHEWTHDTGELDLCTIASSEVDGVIDAISRLPNLKIVKLSDRFGRSNLSVADVKKMSTSCPNIDFYYDFKLFGQSVSTMDEQMVFDEVNIGNEGVSQIRDALDIMDKCTYVKLDSCKIDDETMAKLRDDYPDREIVWRIFIDRYNMLTDEIMVRMTEKVHDGNVTPLKYCTKVKYLDVNFNRLSDFSFVEYMPELECAVLRLTLVSDLTPFTKCPNLTWLELTDCSKLTDLSPLAQLRNLKFLNIAQTKISDISALENLPLERFVCVKTNVTGDSLDAFVAKHPDCLTVTSGSARGYGWRYNDYDQTPFEYYSKIEEIFRYNDYEFTGNRKGK